MSATPDLWQRVKEFVADALERRAQSLRDDVPARENIEAGAPVRSIVARAADHAEVWDYEVPSPTNIVGCGPGARLGTYQIVREIGRSRKGVVFLATAAGRGHDKNFTVKVLEGGIDADEVQWRFRSEREILARLDHPNISPLVDAGVSKEGQAYLVSDYVDGWPITDFFEARRSSLRERVRLFLEICSAVHFGHRNLIVHGNLKPGNILVTPDGVPKLLDFGVSRLIAPGGDVRLMTPEDRRHISPDYMSPEQIRGEPVTTISDVYALGAVLYELVTGAPPHQFSTPHPSAAEMFRIVAEDEPRRASSVVQSRSVRRQLRGDLDGILRTALRKATEKRYSGVMAFSDELRRYLDKRPVRARRDTAAYLAWKFIQRNPFATGAATLITLVLAASIAATVWQSRQDNIERARAERRFSDVRQVVHNVLFDYHDAIASLPGSAPIRERLIRDALAYLDNVYREAGDNRDLLRELADSYQKVGQIHSGPYASFGNARGISSYSKSIEIRQKLLATDPNNRDLQDEAAATHEGLADLLYAGGDLAGSAKSYEQAIELRRSMISTSGENVLYEMALADLFVKLGDIKAKEGYGNGGDPSGAVADWQQAQQILEPLAETRPENQQAKAKLAAVLTHLGTHYRAAGNFTEALNIDRKAVVMHEQVATANPNNRVYEKDLIVARNTLRNALEDTNQTSEAVEQSRRLATNLQKIIAADPKNLPAKQNLAIAYNSLGKNLLKAGDVVHSLENHQKALAITQEILATDPKSEDNKSNLSFMLEMLAQAQVAHQEPKAAMQNYRKALGLREPALLANPSDGRAKEDVSCIQAEIGMALAATGNFEGAIGAFNKSLPLAEEVSKTNARSRVRLAQRYFELGEVHTQFARIARDQKSQWRRAKDCFTRSLSIWQELREAGKLLPMDANQADQVAHNLAQCEAALKL